MRPISTAILLALIGTGAFAGELTGDGAVSAGGFGMSGADYYGDICSRMPFTHEAPPHPISMADVKRVRASRKRAEAVSRRVAGRHHQRRRLPHV